MHSSAQHLYGYHGDERPEVANVIIRREHVSAASNDIGFVKIDGTYRAIVSDYDRHQHGSAWLDRIKQAYAKNVVVKETRRSGMHIVSTDRQDDGSIRMVLEI